MKKELLNIKTKDRESIALWKLTSKNSFPKNIFLTHGTFSNKKVCLGIASYLTEKGFTCWIMEWRNHGNSSKPKQNFNFETIAKFDLRSTFEYFFDKLKLTNIDCVVHSGGGIALSMFLINNPKYLSKINSISMFGVQAFGAGMNFNNRLKILLSKHLSAALGKVPSKTAGSSEHNESYYTMKQWFNWNLNNNFVGENNFDYLTRMNTIKIPILSICAKGDKFIAPKIGCDEFLKAFENPKNNLVYCSKENGNLEDYNHSRIILSKSSKKELYPLVLNWIENNKLLPTPHKIYAYI